jgi:hypothetical protein
MFKDYVPLVWGLLKVGFCLLTPVLRCWRFGLGLFDAGLDISDISVWFEVYLRLANGFQSGAGLFLGLV